MEKQLVFWRLMSATYFKDQPWLLREREEMGCAVCPETHIRIARSCHPFIALISLVIDQPWLLQESGETGCAIRNSHAHRSIVPSVISARTCISGKTKI